MSRYGAVEPDDPFLSDSVDSWLFRALSGMVSSLINKSAPSLPSLKSAVTIKRNDIPAMFEKILSLKKPSTMKAGPPEVALVVV